MNDYGNLFPFQANQLAPHNAELLQIICGSLLLASVIIYAIYRLLRHRDSILMFTLCAGVIPFLNSGNTNVLIHITQPANSMLPLFSNFGMTMTLGSGIVYLAVFPAVSYAVYRLLKKGVNTKEFFSIWGVLCLVDIIIELPSVTAGLYIYQPPQMLTILGFPLYHIWINGTSWIFGGVIMYFFVPVLTDWRRPVISILPFFGYAAGWSIIAFPINLALNVASIPAWGQWTLWFLSFGFSMVVLTTLNSMISTDSGSRWELPWEELIR